VAVALEETDRLLPQALMEQLILAVAVAVRPVMDQLFRIRQVQVVAEL
jgi:hypothetical protein